VLNNSVRLWGKQITWKIRSQKQGFNCGQPLRFPW